MKMVNFVHEERIIRNPSLVNNQTYCPYLIVITFWEPNYQMLDEELSYNLGKLRNDK